MQTEMNLKTAHTKTAHTKKYMRLLLCIACMLCAAAILSGCADNGAGDENFKVDTAQAASEILQNVQFDSEMTEIDIDALGIMYTIEENIQAKAYVAGGALSDELVIFTAPDKAAAEKMLENAKAHIEERVKLFEGYAPAEVEKLNKAYVKQRGVYVVVCVSGNAAQAADIIGRYF